MEALYLETVLLPQQYTCCVKHEAPPQPQIHGKWPAAGNHLQMLIFNCLNCFKSFLSFILTSYFWDFCRHVGDELTPKGTEGQGWHSADCQQRHDPSFPPLVNRGLQNTACSWEFPNLTETLP